MKVFISRHDWRVYVQETTETRLSKSAWNADEGHERGRRGRLNPSWNDSVGLCLRESGVMPQEWNLFARTADRIIKERSRNYRMT